MEGETRRARRRYCRPVQLATAACAPFVVLLLAASAAASATAAAGGEAVAAWRMTVEDTVVEVAELGGMLHRRVWSSKEISPGKHALSPDGGVCIESCATKGRGDPYTIPVTEHCNRMYHNQGC